MGNSENIQSTIEHCQTNISNHAGARRISKYTQENITKALSYEDIEDINPVFIAEMGSTVGLEAAFVLGEDGSLQIYNNPEGWKCYTNSAEELEEALQGFTSALYNHTSR